MTRNFISLHYDGPITIEHKLQLRTLGSTLTHMQASIDRTYIELKYGRVVKHARLSSKDYPATDFLLERPRDGGFIIDMANKSRHAIADRFYEALSRAVQKSAQEPIDFVESLRKQVERRKDLLNIGLDTPISNKEFVAEYESQPATIRYGDRAINREFDQVLSQLRVPRHEGSTLEVTVAGENARPIIRFDSVIARQFHRTISKRTLGDPVIVEIQVRALDSGSKNTNLRGKAVNTLTNREFSLHFHNELDFNQMTSYIKAGSRPAIKIIACPVLEYGVFDPLAGDMFFISLIES